jgi:inorganic pyrophosphatase
LPCRPLGVVEMDQEDQEGRRERNDRVIVMPSWHDRLEEFENASDLPERLREEIEQFFLSTTFFSAKKPTILGWKGPKKASSIMKESNKTYLLQDV